MSGPRSRALAVETGNRMAHDEVRLPENVERGARGGPGFNTTVLKLFSGFERRNQNFANPKGRWDLSYGITNKVNLDNVINFFYARRARHRSFRFKDWSDFQIGNTFTFDASTRQNIGTGDGVITVFQVFKRYTDGGAFTFDRTIKKLVAGTLKVYKDGVLQISGFTADNNTGLITFTSPPANGVLVAVICEFDVPVRFDHDNLDITTEVFDSDAKMSLPSINVVEIPV